jgi:3-hydroxybutyryl-CoA dehydratase
LEKLYFEDCRVGDRIISPARTITETDLVQFAALTGDWHPLHTDAEYARSSLFGERIAHGMLVVAIGSGLLFRAGPHAILPKFTLAAAGVDKVRFVVPTKIGDTIHLEGEVAQTVVIDEERGLIIARHRMVNQRGQAVLTLTTKTLVRRRPRREE